MTFLIFPYSGTHLKWGLNDFLDNDGVLNQGTTEKILVKSQYLEEHLEMNEKAGETSEQKMKCSYRIYW